MSLVVQEEGLGVLVLRGISILSRVRSRGRAFDKGNTELLIDIKRNIVPMGCARY
jgi:hypothetical protein